MKIFIVICSIAIFFSTSAVSQGYEISGSVGFEGRVFFDDPLYTGQKHDSASVSFQPELYQEWKNGSSLTFIPFVRLDSADPERTHVDVRELSYTWVDDTYELRIGVRKVFWGVMEFIHLVDIINQTDLVEDPDGEDKLGQPMMNVSIPGDWGILDLFVMPYFRERTFPGKRGRFRFAHVVDTDRAIYESSAKEYNVDLAVRYSHSIGDWDFGIYHFKGNGREPTFLPGIDSNGNQILVPFYEQIDQTGIDIQAVKGNWLLKFESFYRSGQGDDFLAVATGVEYSFINMASTGMDLGLIGEWAYDDRGSESTTLFDNELMVGARLALNDAEGTDFLMGVIQDLNSRGTVLTVESSRRLSDHWRIYFDAFFVLDSSAEDMVVHSFRKDDSIQLELAYYF
jgi:hypothetical protein